MTADLIYVNGKPFFGRVEEQKQFRAALKETLRPPRGETLPYVILLYGDGGIGKTTLARRFRDIAEKEPPFAGQVQTLWVDWEAERNRWADLQVGREHIHPETVFDVIYTLAARQGWEKPFAAYRQTRDERKKAEAQALQALQSSGERDELAALRGLGAETLAALVRKVLPIGERGEKLTRAFLEAGIKVGAEEAYALRRSIEARLKARLGVQQFDLYLHPHEALARALADGFKRLSDRRALLVVLDTYEIVDRADPWLRLVIQSAGPRLLWIISGRNNLRDSRPYGKGYFRGYSEDFPRRLLAYDLAQLALEDVKAYFAAAVPRRPLDAEAARAIRRATHGIPLAVAQAAEMWARGVPLEEIVGDSDEATPGREIVRKMTARYLLHAVRPEDRRALYALALARGDLELLRALLAPADGSPFDLEAELRRLERDYASVVAFEGRLHDEPQTFFLAHLREPLQRQSDMVRDLLARAEAALRARLARLEAEYPLLEERHADEDWRRTVLDLTEILFWQGEERAWPFLMARFVESLAYSRDLRRGLLETAARWEKTLSARGKRRLQALRDEEGTLLRELHRAADLGWLGGEGEAERRAILRWQEGKWLFRQGRHADALAAYEAAERGLPPGGETLREHLAEALDTLAGELMWPDKRGSAVHHPDAVRILQKVTAWQPGNPGAWYRLGVALNNAGKHEEAIQAFQKAIELDPKFAALWYGLGIVYRHLGRHQEAIQAYQKAIELDPKFASPWNGLGNVYHDLGRHQEAIEAYQKAIELDPKYATPWNGLGNVYYTLDRHQEAIQAYQKAIELDPQDAAPWNGLGNVYANLGRHQEAIQAFQKAIELDPQYAYPWNGLGNVYHTLGRHQEAIEAYRKALELPDVTGTPASAHTLAWNGLGNVYRALGRHQEAIQAYQKAIELDPQDAYPWNGLGNVYHDLGRHQEAIEAYQKAIELDPKFASPWNGLGNVYRALGRHQEAIAAYQQAIELYGRVGDSPRQAAIPWNGLGNVYHDLGRHQEAIQAYQKAIELYGRVGDSPRQAADSWLGLGLVYALRGEWEQALEAFRRAAELAPDDGVYLASLAGALLALGREAEAQEALARARPLMQKENEYNRACFAAICGDTEEALRLLEIALQKRQVSKEWARQDPDLRALHGDPRFQALVEQG